MSESHALFNRRAVRRHRDRSAPGLGEHDFLIREVADRLADRLDDVRRDFPLALDLGCRGGIMAEVLGARGGIETLVQVDLSPAMAVSVAVDEEFLPFASGSFDLIIGNLSLHWANDLPGALIQIRRALKPGGLFLATLFGGETLRELRWALTSAEADLDGGASPRISPFATVKDAGDLLQRAGFIEPVADQDAITVSYGEPIRLMADLRGMGEANALLKRRKAFTRRATVFEAARRYVERFGDPGGRVPATFEVLFLTGWSDRAIGVREAKTHYD